MTNAVPQFSNDVATKVVATQDDSELLEAMNNSSELSPEIDVCQIKTQGLSASIL